MRLKVKKLHPDAVLPTYGSGGAACFDLYSLPCAMPRHAYGGERLTIRTGLSFEIPAGWAMLIYSRSSHGFNNETRLANCVGVIDSDYRGEVMVKLAVDANGFFQSNGGHRIAQAMLVPVERTEFDLVDELGATARGTGGFGSTGA